MATIAITSALKRSLLAALFVFLLSARIAAQCPVNNPDDEIPPELPLVSSSTRHGEPRLPESGYLSNTSYASTYFGFVVDLPLPLDGHRLMMPLMPPGQHALLAVGFQEGHRTGTFLITATEPNNPLHEMTDEERKAEFQAWAKGEPRHQITPPDWLTRTGRFYHIAQHKGDLTTVQYWTFIKNYLIRIKVESNDRDFLSKTKLAIGGLRFYCAQEDGTVIDEQGKIVPTPGEGYQGPTIPTALVNAALDEQPALEQIDTGEVASGLYRNEDIGLTYIYPTTWDVLQSQTDSAAKDEIEQRTRDVMNACSLVLLRLAPPAAEGAADDGRTLTLRAIDQTCLALPAPASLTDHLGAEALGAYLQMLGAYGELRSTNLAMYANHLFAEYSGVVGEHLEGQPLAQRRHEAVAVTRHRKLLLVWSWVAPSLADLGTMPKTSVSFEDEPPIDLIATTILAQR
jgi:hypothetical protein